MSNRWSTFHAPNAGIYTPNLSSSHKGGLRRIHDDDARRRAAAGPPKLQLHYFLRVEDLLRHMIQVPVTPVTVELSGTPLANGLTGAAWYTGRATLHHECDLPVGTAAVSFLALQTHVDVCLEINGTLCTEDGMVVAWKTPVNTDTMNLTDFIFAMVSKQLVQCTVQADASSPHFNKLFDLNISFRDDCVHIHMIERAPPGCPAAPAPAATAAHSGALPGPTHLGL